MLGVVGIGASAGGLEALEEFFAAVDPQLGYSYVVVQHLSPDFKSHMRELLERKTALPICTIEDGMVLEANKLFLTPPSTSLRFRDGRLHLLPRDASAAVPMPIDESFAAIGREYQGDSIVCMLSGTGSDGSRGIVEAKRDGSLVFAQDSESASFDGMPHNAAATGVVDVVARPSELAAAVAAYQSGPSSFRSFCADLDASYREDPPAYARLWRLFRARHGVDFGDYKTATVQRRIERRMALDGFRELEDFADRLEADDALREKMYRDLLVEVTQFFRDPAAFASLEHEVLPALVDAAREAGQMRVWVAGCATGEEAYSIAMLCDEAIARSASEIELKVFATDVHHRSLESASAGVFRIEACEALSRDRRERYFEVRNDLCYVQSRLRKHVVFATHDLTRDPPFTKLDLISCRNVMIYLKPTVQERAIKQFHFGLRKGGGLFLGPSETTGGFESEFRVVDKRWRIFSKRRDLRFTEKDVSLANNTAPRYSGSRASRIPSLQGADNKREVQAVIQRIASRLLPRSLLVDTNYEVVFTFGDAATLLQQPTGKSTLDVIRLLPKGLRSVVKAALSRCDRTDLPVEVTDLPDEDDETRRYGVEVSSVSTGVSKFFLISVTMADPVFDAAGLASAQSAGGADSDTERDEVAGDSSKASELFDERVRVLQADLDKTRATLRTTVSELESSNEALQTMNQELVTANEELQSANEELHSVNEKLFTVNSEHQRKIQELDRASIGTYRVLDAAEIALIRLDASLVIREFSPEVTKLFHILDRDVDRPIDHIALRFSLDDFRSCLRQVVERGETVERWVRDDEGRAQFMRATPYQQEGEANGVVVAFVSCSPPAA